MNYFRKIFKYALPFKKYMFLNIFFNILYALFSALSFLSLMPMLEVLFGENKTTVEKPEFENLSSFGNNLEEWINYQVSHFSGEDPKLALIFVISSIIVLFFLKNFFNYLAMFFITFLRNGVLTSLRENLYKKIISMPLPFFSEKKKGDVISRITADILEIQHSFLSILELIIREPLTIFFTLIAMFLISYKLTVFVLFFIPISGFIIALIGKSLKATSTLVQTEQAEFLSITEETLQGLKVIKGFVSELFFIDKFKKSNNKFYKYSNRLINRQNLASPISEFLGISVIGALLWYGGQLVLVDLELKPAAFLTYMGLAYGVLTPAKAISKASYSIKKGNAAAERVLEILESESSIKEIKNPINKQSFDSEIIFKNVSFKYDQESVLNNINFKIQKGQTIAIVGQSGSGKSTIANLIPRFYDVCSGEILIDGINIKDLYKSELRKLMGLVSQESILFNDSISNNIKLSNSKVNLKEIEESAKIANANEFIEKFEDGYDLNVGDGGGKLSGGQKQRISIARAVLSNPPIMILDEATSSLDSESEKLVQDALENLMKNRTSIIIAHRLSTIQKADIILVINEGKIAEQGKHEELIKENGIYSKLIKLQSFV
ncbi:MAG: ABC transporter ATP-binding protein [Flavobacteriaceae bacterium]|nr:ABC transporter ATP-binding protein [Flavobacteriaceae bacterium]MBT5596539.1 ABC transporter ATP-binding protein [Flavobacteriaceae bacterium]MBT7010841.1 ABC transporter ATP-binding protein [Flavobacteriaceae bacterium]MBT7553888.1 ABC transporter ATP-binding protein [Flavobacteriaceae bacterium]